MLLFAVAGAPRSTPKPGETLLGLRRAHELGITAMELEWVQTVPRNPEHVAAVGKLARELGITLTVHAPYYVNLNSPDHAKLLASQKRIIDALSMAQIAGTRSVCVHAAFYLGMEPLMAFDNVRRAIAEILKSKELLFPSANLALETMGKLTQFGTLEEVLAVSREFGLYPCLDPAHMQARTNGNCNSKEHWNEMFDLYETQLGEGALRNMHMHYSGIAYGARGEKRHLPLQESDARWEDFLSVLKERKIGGALVCESPIQEKDTLLLQKTFATL
ncbi:MAG: TIM barrel protein [Patescibacteria group bacterium]